MLKKNPRFTLFALLVLTIAIGAGALVFRVLTLHPHANSVDLGSLKERLRTAEIPNLHSVLVIQHDQMIAEWYFEGADQERGRGSLGTVKFGPETLHDVRSITKSIVSVLFGIAMAPGYVTTVAADPAHDIEVVGGSQSARLLKLTTGAQLGTVGDATNFAAISNTGSLIFTYTSRGFAIWDATGRLRGLKPGDNYYTMAISPDNRWLAAAPSNQLTDVAVWDLTEVIAACSSDAAVSGGPTKVANGKITSAAVTEPVRPCPKSSAVTR